jgi:hypothetical protein
MGPEVVGLIRYSLDYRRRVSHFKIPELHGYQRAQLGVAKPRANSPFLFSPS